MKVQKLTSSTLSISSKKNDLALMGTITDCYLYPNLISFILGDDVLSHDNESGLI